MKFNKHENQLLKFENEAKIRKIKSICCIIFRHGRCSEETYNFTNAKFVNSITPQI